MEKIQTRALFGLIIILPLIDKISVKPLQKNLFLIASAVPRIFYSLSKLGSYKKIYQSRFSYVEVIINILFVMYTITLNYMERS